MAIKDLVCIAGNNQASPPRMNLATRLAPTDANSLAPSRLHSGSGHSMPSDDLTASLNLDSAVQQTHPTTTNGGCPFHERKCTQFFFCPEAHPLI
jgi:hypothetical protein